MKNIEEKSLVPINEGSIINKIRRFFRNLFKSKNEIIQSQLSNINYDVKDTKKNAFTESLRNIEDEETRLLHLQRQYDTGNMKADDLLDNQVKELIKLYKKQISELRKSNEAKKLKLLQYKKSLQ